LYFLEDGLRILEINAVQFLLGQAFEQVQVVN